MKSFLTLKLLVIVTLFMDLSAMADDAKSVVVPVSQQGEEIAKPERGMVQQTVAGKFGAPGQRFPAVGDPPITRWDYPSFTVYFEGDKVIHAVTKAAPKP